MALCEHFAPEPSMKHSALVFCEDAWHSAASVQDALSALDNTDFDFRFVTRGDEWSPELLLQFSVVIVTKANHLSGNDHRPWLTTQSQTAFRKYVRAGGGLFLIHSGVCFRDLAEMRAVAGGTFLSHPPPCPVTLKPKLGNPLAAGITTFTVEDEHYFLALEVKDADVFLHARSQYGTQPAGWIRTEGEGRVCVLTPGHNREVWMHPDYQVLLRNGLVWLAQ